MCVQFNIVVGHLGRPHSTHTVPMPVLTGSVHAHILTKPSRAGFAVIRLELIEPGAETCVYQAKSCSPTDQPVRKFKYGLGINMTIKTFTLRITSCEKHSTEWRLPAATVTTDAKPHAQQQLARDLEERAVMGQRCRPHSFGEVQRCNTLYFL